MHLIFDSPGPSQRTRLKPGIMTALALTAIGLPSASADVVRYVDATRPGGGNGQSWQTAYNNLQTALDASAGVTELRVADGVYLPTQRFTANDPRSVRFQLVSGLILRGGYAGFGAANPDARDPVAFESRLSGDLAGDDEPGFENTFENAYHVLRAASDTSATAVLDGFVITAGNANGGGEGERDSGGGLYNDGGQPTLVDCVFRLNNGRVRAGGMYNTNGAAPSLLRCTFDQNQASRPSAGDGGAMYNVLSNVSATDCLFFSNHATNVSGAIYNQGTSRFERCRFIGNAADVDGGAVSEIGDAEYIGCTFSGNISGGVGGAVRYDRFFGATVPTFTNCSFAGNGAETGGGAIYASAFFALGNGPSWRNCILWGDHSSSGGSEIELAGAAMATFSYCDVQNGQVGIVVGGSAMLVWGAGNLLANPQYLDADGIDNISGTLDDNVHLLSNSPCIEAGDPAFVPNPGQTDIDGDPRVLACRVDIGVDESTFITPGNGDLDGMNGTNSADTPLFVQLLLGLGNPAQACAADMNGDGRIDGRDIALFVQALIP